MPDREKVITALENCLNIPPCRNCPWDECTITHETVEIPRGLAHAALALLKEHEARWIPVAERLPEAGCGVLVWEEDGFVYVDRYVDGKWWIADAYCAEITHWMPLPEPPKEEGDAEVH